MCIVKFVAVYLFIILILSVLKLEKVARVINFLVVDCETVLRSAIDLLDPLPSITALMAACKVVSHPNSSLLWVSYCN